MCGINGIALSARSGQRIDAGVLARMRDVITHRGPDDEGLFIDGLVGFGHRRLSIVDVAGGHQPMTNEDGTLHITYNGEIYNHADYREELEARGHVYRTHCDTETILHLYEEYGVDCVQHLRGMFAFALWDAKQQRLLLARDRMGEKPLYLYEQDGQLLFTSELKALLSSGIVPFELDAKAIDLYFHYQFVPEPQTPITGVRKLDAGHLLVVETDPWRIKEICYWRMLDAPPLDGDPAKLIREELETISELV